MISEPQDKTATLLTCFNVAGVSVAMPSNRFQVLSLLPTACPKGTPPCECCPPPSTGCRPWSRNEFEDHRRFGTVRLWVKKFDIIWISLLLLYLLRWLTFLKITLTKYSSKSFFWFLEIFKAVKSRNIKQNCLAKQSKLYHSLSEMSTLTAYTFTKVDRSFVKFNIKF